MKQSKLALLISAASLLMTIFTPLAPAGHAFGSEPKPKKKQTRGAYRAELDRLIRENKVNCQISLDCEAVALGEKSCGGPTEYVVLSKATRKKIQDAVTDLTKTITQLDHEANAEGGMMGTCDVIEKPEVECKAGTCLATGAPRS